MKVTVIPKRPIPGILPKNKWIDSKMELDLNKKEISHCMQFGDVYDETGNLIDSIKIKLIPSRIVQFTSKSTEDRSITEIINVGEPIVIDKKQEPIKEVWLGPIAIEPITEIEVPEPMVEEVPTPIIVEEEPVEEKYFNLKEVSCVKKDEYIVLTTQVDSNYELEGNLYGLFTTTSGSRPSSIEFDEGVQWIKFSTKFANFTEIKNGTKFTFRLIARDENEFSYKILIKQAAEELVRFEGKVNPSEL